MLRRSQDRIYYITLFIAALFAVYGFVSIEFIQSFEPKATLFSNIWPRLLFNTLPLLFLARFIRRSSTALFRDTIIWLVSFTLIYDAACMIYVWPIALQGKPQIILFVSAANSSVFFAVSMLLAFSLRESAFIVATVGTLFWAPLLWIVYQGGDPLIFKAVLNDTLFLGTAGIVFGVGFSRGEQRLSLLELEKQLAVTRFLSPLVSRAVFHNDPLVLSQKTVTGFIICTDLRESTANFHKHGKLWTAFRNDYFNLVNRCVTKHGGHVQKTMGDGHIINFGVMDDQASLVDIPGLETEEMRARERQLKYFSDKAFACLEELFQEFQVLNRVHFPGETFRMGAGIDKGEVERALQGQENINLELDVNGDAVNCSYRLQEYSKLLQSKFSDDASLLVISPFASDYISDISAYQKIVVIDKYIRDYPQIKWVLVRPFKKAQKPNQNRSAA